MDCLRFCAALALALPWIGYADDTPLVCTVTAGSTPTIRSEGLTELVGDLLLNCASGTPTPAGQPVPLVNVGLVLNVNAGNGNLFPNSAFTDARLLIGEPAPGNQHAAAVTAESNLSLTTPIFGVGGSGIDYASVPNVFEGIVTGKTVTWLGVPLDGTTSPSGRVLRITNLRVNANSLAPSADGTPGQITAFLSLAGLTPITVNNPRQVLATVQDGLGISMTTGSVHHDRPYNLQLLGANPVIPSIPGATIKVSPLFPTAFKTSQAPTNTPGLFYNSDAGFQGPGLPSPSGLADFGTRLRLAFNNVPPGVSIFLPQKLTNAAGSMETTLGTPQSSGLVKGFLSGNTVTEVYEVKSWDYTKAAPFVIPVYPAFNSGGTIDTAPTAPSHIQTTVGFDSPANGAAAFASDPVPGSSRLPPTLFSINSATGAVPRFTANMDSRPCIYASLLVPTILLYPDFGNACAPGSGPVFNVTSDSGPVHPTLTTTQPGGISLNPSAQDHKGAPHLTAALGSGPLTGPTPLDGILQVNVQGVSPGTYQSTLTFSAPDSSTPPINVPYTVTVLPANNPVITRQGFDDVGNYKAGTVAPGQIFVLFGQNFGPSTGLVQATLDASGKIGTTVGGTQVLFDGVASPLIYVTSNQSTGQVAGVAPFGLKGKATTKVQVVYNGLTSPAVTLPVKTSNLSILSADGSGGNGAVAVNPNGNVNSVSNPASVGDVLVFYISYAGPLDTPGTDGRTTTSAPYPKPAGPLAVSIGGVPATDIQYFGNVPTLLESVMQVNVRVPAGVKAGSYLPVVISAGDAVSAPWTSIAVK